MGKEEIKQLMLLLYSVVKNLSKIVESLNDIKTQNFIKFYKYEEKFAICINNVPYLLEDRFSKISYKILFDLKNYKETSITDLDSNELELIRKFIPANTHLF